MNTSSQSQTIFKKTVVGVTSPVTEIIVPKREGSVKHVMPGENKERISPNTSWSYLLGQKQVSQRNK